MKCFTAQDRAKAQPPRSRPASTGSGDCDRRTPAGSVVARRSHHAREERIHLRLDLGIGLSFRARLRPALIAGGGNDDRARGGRGLGLPLPRPLRPVKVGDGHGWRTGNR